MSLPVITVVIPTVPGREDHLERCTRAYAENATGNYDLDLIVEHGHATCGLAWQAGAGNARGAFIHLTDDDIEPLPGWHAPALEAVRRGYLPAPQVCDPDGNPQSWPQPGRLGDDWAPVHMTSLPFCSREQWEKITPLMVGHYFTDDFFSYRGRKAGWPCVLRAGYAFTHHWAQPGRGAGMTQDERMAHDRQLYEQAVAMDGRGQWTRPWPPGGG